MLSTAAAACHRRIPGITRVPINPQLLLLPMSEDELVTIEYSPVPDGYSELLAAVKADVLGSQLRVTRTASTELITLYWRVGRLILDRQDQQGWGARIINRLSADLKRELPGTRGWSVSNLASMRALAAAWPSPVILQQAVGELPWGQVVTLLAKLDTQHDRDWYAQQAAANQWSRKVLEHHIATRLRDRIGAAPSNFPAALDAADSDQAQELLRDPYVFDFLGLTTRATERELEDAMMAKLTDTMLELGGLALVGRQKRLTAGTKEFFIDLLFFDVEQSRYVVFELKVGDFTHEYAGQLGFYVTLVDDKLRRPDRHRATVGILLCASRDDSVVRYALQSTTAPIAVSTYTYDTLPPAEQATLPAAADVIAAVTMSGSGTLSLTGPTVEPAVGMTGSGMTGSGTLSVTSEAWPPTDDST